MLVVLMCEVFALYVGKSWAKMEGYLHSCSESEVN